MVIGPAPAQETLKFGFSSTFLELPTSPLVHVLVFFSRAEGSMFDEDCNTLVKHGPFTRGKKADVWLVHVLS